MNGLRKILSVVLLTIVISTITYAQDIGSKSAKVAIIYNPDKSIHVETIDSLKAVLIQQGISSEAIVTINNQDRSQATKQLSAENIDYSVAIGVVSTEMLIKAGVQHPAISVLVPKQTFRKVLQRNTNSQTNISVIPLGQSAERRARLSRLILGKRGKLGIAAGEYSINTATEIKKESERLAIDVTLEKISGEGKHLDELERLVRDTDIFMALYDPAVLNRHNAKLLLYMAYKMNKPVIGYSKGFTRAGAVASIYSTPSQIGKQAGVWLSQTILNGSSEAVGYANEFSVSINKKVQRVLRLERLDEEEVVTIIRRQEGSE